MFVANGQNHTPNVPNNYRDIDLYGGNIQHSHSYRTPKPFIQRSVLIIGAGPSGLDLGLLIGPHAERLALSHHSEIPPTMRQGLSIEMRPAVERFTRDGVIFVDGREETYTDVILCTGYRHSWLIYKCGFV